MAPYYDHGHAQWGIADFVLLLSTWEKSQWNTRKKKFLQTGFFNFFWKIKFPIERIQITSKMSRKVEEKWIMKVKKRTKSVPKLDQKLKISTEGPKNEQNTDKNEIKCQAEDNLK